MVMRGFIIASIAMLITNTADAAYFVYTKTSGAMCAVAHQNTEQEVSSWRCRGPAGYGAMFFDEGNIVGVAFGPSGHERPLLANDLSWVGADKPFGCCGKIEWRIAGSKPYAAIMRIWRSDTDKTGRQHTVQMLLVAKVTPRGSCKIGVVDTESRNANQIARDLADAASNFRCGADHPKFISAM